MSAALLSDVTPGFTQPVHGAQSVFRELLEAMSRPGRVRALAPDALQGLHAPALRDATMGRAMAALLLTLLDAETTLQLGAALATPQAIAFCRFHTGVNVAEPGAGAAFSAWRAQDVTPALWDELCDGSDESPQLGATLLIEVAALGTDAATPRGRSLGLRLRGPGIESMHLLNVGGLDAEFWRQRIAMQPRFPRGIDLVLCCADRLAAIPRSTFIELDG